MIRSEFEYNVGKKKFASFVTNNKKKDEAVAVVAVTLTVVVVLAKVEVVLVEVVLVKSLFLPCKYFENQVSAPI